jgi:hypothetical protein
MGKSFQHGAERRCTSCNSIWSAVKCLHPRAEPGGATQQAWIDLIEGMWQRGYLDDRNAIVSSTNLALGFPAWFFKHFFAVMGTLDLNGAYLANRDEGNPVNLGAFMSSGVSAWLSGSLFVSLCWTFQNVPFIARINKNNKLMRTVLKFCVHNVKLIV